jgi:5-formyltetrahydrofolate cyclo-ligase
VRAGIAYTLQRVERVPTDTHDVPLHFVITEEGRIACSA